MFCQFPTVRKCDARIEKKTIASPRAAAIPISRRRNVAAASSWADMRRGVADHARLPDPGRCLDHALLCRLRPRQLGDEAPLAHDEDRGRSSRGPPAARTRSRRIVRPCVARCEIVRWTSAFVPTSTPCVGSSRSRILGSAASHFAEHDLLLVAAREAAHDLRGRGRLDPQLLHEAPGERALAPRPQDPARRQLGQDRHRDVRADGHRLHEPLVEPVLRAGRRARGRAPRSASAAGTRGRRSRARRPRADRSRRCCARPRCGRSRRSRPGRRSRRDGARTRRSRRRRGASALRP